MFSNVKPLNRHGRPRFGSTMFVDRDEEKLVEIVTGEKRLRHVLNLGIVLIISKFLIMNPIGLMTSVIFYYLLYSFSIQDITISFTENRVFSINRFRHPRITRGLAIFAIGWVIVSSVTLFTDFKVIDLETSISWVEAIFSYLNILPVFFNLYLQSTINSYPTLFLIDNYLSILINIYLGVQFLFIDYRFSEINNSQISDVLIRITKKTSMRRLALLLLFDIILLLLFRNLSIFYIIFVVIIHVVVPKEKYSEINFFGHSGRVVVPAIAVSFKDNHKILRSTRYLFKLGNFKSTNKYPLNIIPNQIASFYETGLQASLGSALNQGNTIGMGLAVIINLFVIVNLFRFAFQININTLPEVFGITSGVGIGIAVGWVALRILSNRIGQFQKDEYLMIGQNFIGRWLEEGLWIIRGDKLEGRRKSRRIFQRFLKYERAGGFRVAWTTVILIIVLGLLSLLLLFWISIGALNLTKLVFVFPFLFDLGLNFLSTKANAELGFFIISSFILWPIIYYFYPSYYARTRPQFGVELEHLLPITVILKNEQDQSDAMSEFTKCIISSARSDRRPSSGRPGIFQIAIEMLGSWGSSSENKITFSFGENNRQTQMIGVNQVIESDPLILIKDLRVSGLTGYPAIKFTITEFDKNQDVISQLTSHVHLDGLTEQTLTFTLESDLHVSLKFKVIKVLG